MSNPKYRVKIIFEVKDGDKSAKFYTKVKLPFIPTNETRLRRKDAVAIPLGPFEKVVYDLDDKNIVCWIKPWSPKEYGRDEKADIRQVIENLLTEGWTRINREDLKYELT